MTFVNRASLCLWVLAPLSLAVLLSVPLALNELGSADMWLAFYLADASCVLVGAALSQYLGVTGFFVLTATAGSLFGLVWVSMLYSVLWLKEVSLVDMGSLCKFYGLDVSLVFYVDSVGYSFALLTALISTFVYLYAFSYMRFEKNIISFLSYFKLFGWSMTLLVLSGSWFGLLLGWELIGITSFLLINFWTSKIGTLKSAFKAFVFNKVSDASLILVVCLCISSGLTYLNPNLAFANALASLHFNFGGISFNYADVFLICLTMASFCKSAQFGFHFWLPDSMEAPVPASALIHSATLVSAGIYLLLRFNSVLLVSSFSYASIALVSSFTAFYGAIIAAFQTDVKKILAYSTISHCGMLVFSTLMNSPYITLFYLFAHGFFKSINFMCVGNFIQYSNNYQDTSRMGRYFSSFRFEFFFFCVTLFNLSSAPMFLCFFSKHWLLGSAYAYGPAITLAVAWIYAAAFCGAFYSSKLLYECALASKRTHHSLYQVNAISSYDSSYRRSNGLARFAMSSLFLVAFVTLTIFWSLWYADIASFFDEYSAAVDRAYGSSFYATLLFFSWVLVVTASGYVSLKRQNSFGLSVLSSAVFFTVLSFLA